jgi:hypothetical protein
MPLTLVGYNYDQYQGQVRFVDLGSGNFNFQTIGLSAIYESDLGVLSSRPANLFVGREYGIQRLSYDFNAGMIVDSQGSGVPVAALEAALVSQPVEYVNQSAVWKVMVGDPREFRPGPNQEIVERNVVLDAQGNVRLVDMSYGKGELYDPSRTGGKWRYELSRLTGEPQDPGKGFRTDTSKLRKQVISRSFLVKELRPIGG